MSVDELVGDLIDAKIDLEVVDEDGKTAIFHHCDEPDLLTKFIKAGANVHVVANDGRYLNHYYYSYYYFGENPTVSIL